MAVCDNIERRFSRTIPIVYHNRLVILCHQLSEYDCHNPYRSEKIIPVLNYLSEYNMPTGISTGFSDIQALNSYYEQAYMTLTIGVKLDPQKTSFLFSEYVPYQMMKIVAQPQAFLHPLVQKIRIYDSKHNTEYFKTYKTYMLAGKDKKYAADRLSIHLNTLKYRLNMIDDLFYAGSLSKREELHIVFSFLLDDFENGAAIDSSL